MSVECWVIIVLILAMAVIIMRRGTPRQGVLDFAPGAGPLWIFNRKPHFPLVGRIFPFDQFRFVPCVFYPNCLGLCLCFVWHACREHGWKGNSPGLYVSLRRFQRDFIHRTDSFDSSILISRQAGNGFYEIRYDKKQNNDDRRFIVGIGNLGIRRSFHASMY